MNRIFQRTILCLFTVVALYANAQHSIIDTDKHNLIFNCRYEIYKLQIDSGIVNGSPPYPVTIDSFNVCRVRNQHIKKLKIYYFKSTTDSSLWREIDYLPNRLIKSMHPAIGWFMYAAINPDTISIDCNEHSGIRSWVKPGIRSKTVKSPGRKVVYNFDSAGYLIRLIETERGVLSRWASRNMGGVPVKWVTDYTYQNNHRKVVVNRCGYWKLHSDSCREAGQVICEFDTQGNLLSEKHYSLNASGESLLTEAFRYEYSYFPE